MANPIEIQLKEFVEKFKNQNNRIPTQNEIVKGTNRAAATIKSYLTEESSKEAKWIPDYNWLAREGHPLHDLSTGMLVRHGIYEDPDGFPPKQRFDLARKGNIAVPDWMNELESKKK